SRMSSVCSLKRGLEFLCQIAHLRLFADGVVTTRNHVHLEATASNSFPMQPIVFKSVSVLVVSSKKIGDPGWDLFGRYIIDLRCLIDGPLNARQRIFSNDDFLFVVLFLSSKRKIDVIACAAPRQFLLHTLRRTSKICPHS